MWPTKTRVRFEGPFWRVQFLNCGVWQTDRNLHPTRASARKAAANYC